MTVPTHIITGLLIGKLTGNYYIGVLTSVLIDADHFIKYWKDGRIWKPWTILKSAVSSNKDPSDVAHSSRGFTHGILSFVILSATALFIFGKIGLVFLAAYAIHLIMDLLNKEGIPLLYPFKRSFRLFGGIIPYASLREWILFGILVIGLVVL